MLSWKFPVVLIMIGLADKPLSLALHTLNVAYNLAILNERGCVGKFMIAETRSSDN